MVVIGEDIGKVGGLFRATEGLYERYGGERIRDTPLTESGFVGCGIGAALTGLRPVVELQFSDFSGVAFDQIMNQAAKLRFMMGGAPSIPLVIRMVSGGGVRLGAQHSQSLEALFAHIPGLVVAMPSTPYDAKGLLSAAIRGDDPVIFLEQKLLFFGEEAPVPAERYGIELGVGRVAREGTDVTVVALGALVPHALRAAHELEAEGVSVEVVDPRTLVPLDTELIAASVAKTHRLVVAHEAVQFGGFGSEIAAHVAEHCFWDLDAPVRRVGAASHPIPYQKDLEAATLPGRRRSPPRFARWPPADLRRALLRRLEDDGRDHDGPTDDRHRVGRLPHRHPRPERPQHDLQQRDQRHFGRDDQSGAHREEDEPDAHLADPEEDEQGEVAAADGRGMRERADDEDEQQLREADRRHHRDVAPVPRDHDAGGEGERHREREADPERAPLPGPPTISPTPRSAITMATAALAVIRSRSATQASSAAAIGETACRKRTFATVEWLRATMKEPDAIEVQTATPRPASPIDRNTSTVRPRFVTATKTANATNAKNARPASCVGVSTESSRCRPPAVDQATAAPAMYSCPRRRAVISASCRGSAAPWDRTPP